MVQISTDGRIALLASLAVLSGAVLTGCAGNARLTAGPGTAALAAASTTEFAASEENGESAENAELAAAATEVPVIANAPRLVCRREIPLGSRIGQEVCRMEGGPRTAADELQRIHTEYELEENRLDELLNMGEDLPSDTQLPP